jgi:hypothetical protein
MHHTQGADPRMPRASQGPIGASWPTRGRLLRPQNRRYSPRPDRTARPTRPGRNAGGAGGAHEPRNRTVPAGRRRQPAGQPHPSYRSTHLRHPTQTLRISQTATETTGPAFAAARFPATPDLSGTNGRHAQGERIIIRGRVLDEDDAPVSDTTIEIWQANAAGRYDHLAHNGYDSDAIRLDLREVESNRLVPLKSTLAP